jgi:hypothetical protein
MAEPVADVDVDFSDDDAVNGVAARPDVDAGAEEAKQDSDRSAGGRTSPDADGVPSEAPAASSSEVGKHLMMIRAMQECNHQEPALAL